MFAEILYDKLGFMSVLGLIQHKDKEQKLRIGVGTGIGGVVCMTIADDNHKLLTHIRLEPEQAMELSRSLGESGEMLYGTA